MRAAPEAVVAIVGHAHDTGTVQRDRAARHDQRGRRAGRRQRDRPGVVDRSGALASYGDGDRAAIGDDQAVSVVDGERADVHRRVDGDGGHCARRGAGDHDVVLATERVVGDYAPAPLRRIAPISAPARPRHRGRVRGHTTGAEPPQSAERDDAQRATRNRLSPGHWSITLAVWAEGPDNTAAAVKRIVFSVPHLLGVL